jgi:DNA-binding GntR family transcriptional regulator
MSEATAPFQRANLREQIKDVILERIVSQAYPPGSRLVETRIAQELGVSQAPVREALRDLEQLGCVVHEPFRGCSVRAFSAEDLLEAFPVRAALEALACRLAAPRITDRELDQLEAHIGEMREACASGAALEQSQADTRFHATIVRATRNTTLERQWTLLEPFLRTYISVAKGADPRTLPDRHVPILEALRERDAERASTAMHRHLMDAAELLRSGTEHEDKEPS